MTPSKTPNLETRLSPSFRLPLSIVALSIPCYFLQIWLAAAIAIFGIFLLIQSASLSLVFTASDLDIYRGQTLIRKFPYRDWQNWQIFWRGFPILFYLKEVNSIHFLPVLFDSQTLESCLERHIPKSLTNQTIDNGSINP
jgi:Protein of unknown function (DUF3119)